jgi:hypothetical protein
MSERLVQFFTEFQAQQRLPEYLAVAGRVRERLGTLHTVVEIGSAAGATLALWAELAAPDALLVAVDLPIGPQECYSDKQLHRAACGRRLVLVRGDSRSPATRDAVSNALGGRQADLLFIDCDHQAAAVRCDFRTYAPMVRDGGIVAFHDIVLHPEFPSVRVHELWSELRARFPDDVEQVLEAPDQTWGGIGLLTIGADVREYVAQPVPIPVFINNFNRLKSTRDLALWVASLPGARTIILDNASNWPPLLDWYERCPFEVRRLGTNLGHRAPWICGATLGVTAPHYVVTDPDLSMIGCPTDVLAVLTEGLAQFPWATKAGVGLEIDDIPAAYPSRDLILGIERPYWSHRLDRRFLCAPVDTTFAVYRTGNEPPCAPALRSDRPYVAKHLPWYVCPGEVDEEELHYLKTADTRFSSGTAHTKAAYAIDADYRNPASGLISVCYTSARPSLVPERIQEWTTNSSNAEAIEFVVTIDEAFAADHGSLTKLPRTRVFLNPGRRCCVDGWNLAARKARGDILIQCSDDLHVPRGWDARIRERLKNGATIAVLAISDGLNASADLLPHAIMTRRYYNEFGYMLHDAYWSMWSDNEFSAVAHQKNAVINGLDIQFLHAHGQIHDEVRIRHDGPQRTSAGHSAFSFRQQHGFQPWKFNAFLTDDADSDGIYSPNWRSRLPSYWNPLPKTSDHYLELHRESINRRIRMFGSKPAVQEFEVLVPTVPQRREFLDLLVAELTRQGVPFLVDDRPGLSVGDKRNALIERSTAPYITFVDDDDWLSHNYGEVLSDAIANNHSELDAILYDVVTTIDNESPRGCFLSFELGNRDLPDCYLRLPNHLMVWKRTHAVKERFPSVSKGEDEHWAPRMREHVVSWARVHALLYFYEFLRSNTTR